MASILFEDGDLALMRHGLRQAVAQVPAGVPVKVLMSRFRYRFVNPSAIPSRPDSVRWVTMD